MLLYGTITSERASKGQGGNKFIRIQLTVGDKANQINAGLIELRYIELKGQLNSYDQVDVMYFEPEKNGVYRLINEIKVPKKGKRQKGENCKHLSVSKYAENKGYCDNCGEDLRGDEIPEGALHQ